MSIPLRTGFVDETLERCLEDLMVRFVLNCPEEDLSSIERVLFQIEEAHWFYQDFLRTLNPLLPAMKMKLFTSKLIEQCPLIWKWGDPSEALAQFGKYKSTIPVRGCALLNASMDKMLLVKGIESSSWGFPRGKISKDESDVDCAVRELQEETGFDASDLIDEEVFVKRTIKGKDYKIFIVKDVPEDFDFNPQVRFEIADIQWMGIKYLTKAVNTTNNFYLVGSMLKSITSYINRIKNTESEEQLKKLATIQLRKILGIDGNNENEESMDPGRELLALLKSVGNAESNTHAAPTQSSVLSSPVASLSGTNAPNVLPPGLTPHQQLQFEQQKMFSPFQTNPPFSPFLPPNLLAYQQNRMIPAHAHNPFPLQMFNPYHSFPPFGVPNPMIPQFNNMSSQDMSLAPSASTLTKPHFSQKPSHENSKELLSILKLRPASEDSKKVDSATLLNILKKDSPSIKPSPVMNHTPETSSLSSPNIIIKKRDTGKEVATDTVKPAIHSKIKTKPVKTKIDITQPANDSTSRDMNNSNMSTNPIILLKKGSSNQNTRNATPTSSSVSIATPASPLVASPRILQKTDTISHPNVALLNHLGGANNTNNDPSSQLLSILQKKPTSSSNQEASSNTIDKQLQPELKETPTQPTNPPSSTDSSKVLMDILKAPSTPTLLTAEKTTTHVDPSKDILNILKKNNLPLKKEPVANDISQNLLQALKFDNSTPRNTASAPLPSSEDPSAQILNLLKRPTTNSSTDTSTTLLNALKPKESENLSKGLLDMLKPQAATTSQKTFVETVPVETEEMKPQPVINATPDMMSILKNSANLNPETVQNFQNFEDFEDFGNSEWDEEEGNDYEDAAEYIDGDLYGV